MPTSPEATEARAEELVERVFGTPAPRRRMLVIANPYATTVSSRLKHGAVKKHGLRLRVAPRERKTTA